MSRLQRIVETAFISTKAYQRPYKSYYGGKEWSHKHYLTALNSTSVSCALAKTLPISLVNFDDTTAFLWMSNKMLTAKSFAIQVFVYFAACGGRFYQLSTQRHLIEVNGSSVHGGVVESGQQRACSCTYQTACSLSIRCSDLARSHTLSRLMMEWKISEELFGATGSIDDDSVDSTLVYTPNISVNMMRYFRIFVSVSFPGWHQTGWNPVIMSPSRRLPQRE